jgi:hypothetical protein
MRMMTAPRSARPSFRPPSRPSASLPQKSLQVPVIESLLRALPGMIEGSGATLDSLRIDLPADFEEIGDWGTHVAEILRSCSPTLKSLRLSVGDTRVFQIARDADQVERLRAQWAGVLAGVSACRELEVLVLPTSFKVEPLFPLDAAFGRLAHLEMADCKRKHPRDPGVVGLLEVMASGGLPALAKLKVVSESGRLGGRKRVQTRMAPALEAVAGTLTHLDLRTWPGQQSDDVEIGRELGVAVGKLRRLEHLTLQLSHDGRFYHAVAQGLAASGGDRPLPLLRRVVVHSQVGPRADLLASLILRVWKSSSQIISSVPERPC